MNMYVGMSGREQDIYAVAQFVHLPCWRLDAFLKVLEMCGYEVRKKDAATATSGTPDRGTKRD